MNNQIKITIVTATWNCAGTLTDCLDSVAHQNYDNKEHIVIDGGSTDGTIDLVAQRMDAIDLFISEPDNGIYDALNKGIKLSTGDVIGFLHSDDFYTSNDTLKLIAKEFEDPTVSAVYGDLYYVNKSNVSSVLRFWKSKQYKPGFLIRGWMPPHPTFYVRKSWYETVGMFETKYRISADYHCILKLFSHPRFVAKYIPAVLVSMRIGGASNRSILNIFRKSKEDICILRNFGLGMFSAAYVLAFKNLSKIFQFLK